ncbi:MAG: UPF0182 family protein [Stanieria sp.]
MPKLLPERIFRLAVITIGAWLFIDLIAHVVTEILWFQEVNYLSVLLKRWGWQLLLWLVACGVSIGFLLSNWFIANRLAWQWLPQNENNSLEIAYLSERKNQPDLKAQNQKFFLTLKLPLLLILVLMSSSAIAFLVVYYSTIAFHAWHYNYNLPKIIPTLPSLFTWLSVVKIFTAIQQPQYLEQIIIIIFLALLLIFKPKFFLLALSVIISLAFSLILSGNWTVFLQYFNSSLFNNFDPQFGKDISFYVFTFPVWELINLWLLGLFGFTLVGSFLHYLLSGNSLSEGRFKGFSAQQSWHLSSLLSGLFLIIAFRHWLNRYNLLYSQRGVIYGANFTDITIQLPLETILTITAIVVAIWLSLQVLISYRPKKYQFKLGKKRIISWWLILIYLLILVIGNITGLIVQRLVVQPNELAKESKFIQRSIAMTRTAFGLDKIDDQIFIPQDQLTATDIQQNDLTIDNIRLWDTRPILQTNRQLQQIRLYYKFFDADIDRYTLGETENNKQQVIIAPRELDYSSVPQRAQTWVNKHLVYTHGYGFTLSPVNQVDQGGLPFYFVKDIGTGTQEEGTLTVSSELIRQNIPIGQPRIYYGELTDPYIMAPSRVREFDFPSGEENIYNSYDGNGGIRISNYLSRLLFAEYLKDWQMLFTQNFTANTKLLLRRNINRRVRTIAPFLRYDRDPYLVVADVENEQGQKEPNYLYWIIDAYTTSDRYPYSDPEDDDFNYIRNSVKVVIDAYNGDVTFYIAEPEDPIVQTWQKIFPNLFKSLEEMPVNLRRHIRYPEDLFSIQSEKLLIYHMTDAQVFYNREDQWQIPKEIYGTKSQQVEPYYLIMKLPTATKEEFILLHPYTPISRPNLIGWLAARSDGEFYGRLLLYKFPKQRLVYGPNQIEALINQDPVISQQISLWNREGSKAIQGNLLIIPIEQSLLYVEPLYIEAEQNSLPTLARVIVVYENRIVMAETLNEALEAIFNPNIDSDSTIIRPVEELPPVAPE